MTTRDLIETDQQLIKVDLNLLFTKSDGVTAKAFAVEKLTAEIHSSTVFI